MLHSELIEKARERCRKKVRAAKKELEETIIGLEAVRQLKEEGDEKRDDGKCPFIRAQE